MSGVLTQKLNSGHFCLTYKGENGYNVLAQLDGVRKGSMLKLYIEGTIDSYGEITDYRSFFKNRLNCAFSTVSAALKELVREGKALIERNSDGSTTWRSVRTLSKKEMRWQAAQAGKELPEEPAEPYYRVENFFRTHVFDFTYREKRDEQGKVVRPAYTLRRTLTPVEVLVLSVFYTHAYNKEHSWFWTSAKELAEMLHLSKRAVERAIRNLMAAQLLLRPLRGNSKSRHSKYVANMGMIRPLCDRYNPKTPTKARREKSEPTKKSLRKAKKELQEAVAERDRFYTQRRKEAEDCAERNRRYVEKTAPRFKEIERELTAMPRKLAEAECAYDLLEYSKLRKRQRDLEQERAEILHRLNVKDWWLVPQYACKRCLDSGSLPDGSGCTCYGEHLRKLQGETNVGELDK